jgi:Carbohydrate binding domain
VKRSVQLIMLTTSALTGYFVLSGTAGVNVLPQASPPVEELLSNSGFEAPAIEAGTPFSFRPAGWVTFTSGTADQIGLSTVTAHSGKQAVKFVSHGVPNFYQGLYQALPVTLGETYQFSVYIKSDHAKPLKGSLIGQLSVEWHDVNDNEIGRVWGNPWGVALPSTEWTRYELSATTPPNCATAHFVIVEKGEGQPVAGCIFLVDDASVARVTEP